MSGEGDGVDDDLATFADVGTADEFDALSSYLWDWASLFGSDGGGGDGKDRDRGGTSWQRMGLSTPVEVYQSAAGQGQSEGIARSSGVRIIFRPTKSGDAYRNKEEDSDDDWGGDVESDKEQEPKKEGGVEVTTELLADGTSVRVRAYRCEVEEGTLIKEMSEGVILKELKKAIDVWRRGER